ncbi:rCG54008 [Rattus norvegicus]|uniref:RCG54008 n=1 Tax=Rattus norvegicus TaxID=10116 RepID=A6J8K5_RAT|nr:rCG54008 [Rattus norvegicus]
MWSREQRGPQGPGGKDPHPASPILSAPCFWCGPQATPCPSWASGPQLVLCKMGRLASGLLITQVPWEQANSLCCIEQETLGSQTGLQTSPSYIPRTDVPYS